MSKYKFEFMLLDISYDGYTNGVWLGHVNFERALLGIEWNDTEGWVGHILFLRIG